MWVEAIYPLNRFAVYVDARKAMNNLNRDRRIIACRLSRALFQRRSDVDSGAVGWRGASSE
jgi:hypothetical protein